ncbi:hypothetical protein BDW74DRAFT_54542 [Aspergillus multicolor]|uniref:uncharacterized protein n=1 Tax=Aspergillus multicolor TaxID=41759 RepID=UPI003CCDB045
MAPRRLTPIYKHTDAGGSLAITHVHNANQDMPLVDRVIEPQTIAHFLSFCCEGTLPDGKTTTLELLKGAELSLLDEIPETDNNALNFMDRVMSRIGSLEDEARMTIVGRNIWSVKNRAWAGIIPLSEERWAEKGLSHPDNFDTAAQYLSSVLSAFEYLNRPRVQDNMRDTFNLISLHWGEFETYVNARREEGQKSVRLRKLWAEFIAAHFELVTTRAHRWVLAHVDALRDPLVRELGIYRPPNLDEIDTVQWRIMDRLHTLGEIAGVADYTIMLPMHGYHGCVTPSVPPGILPSLRSPSWDVRCKAYGPYLKNISRAQKVQETIERVNRGAPRPPIADPVEFQRTIRLQISCQARVRREIRGEDVEPVPKEPWIPDVLRSVKTGEARVGFVVYRLTYGQGEAEWRAFRENFEAHVSDWGRGQTGSSALKPYLKLLWRDGRECGIPEGDVEAAKRHYLATYPDSKGKEFSQFPDTTPLTLLDSINRRAFLAVDAASYTSYTSSSYKPCIPAIPTGDFTGFVLAVDPDFDPAEGPDRPDETPGFYGQLRVLGSLVWGDLFGMLASQCAILEDLWPLALDHPDHVYAGPLVPLVLKAWRVHNGLRGVLMNEVVKFVRGQCDGRELLTTANPNIGTNIGPGAGTPAGAATGTGPGRSTSTSTSRTPPTRTLPATSPEPNPLRTWMMFQYARYLRERGATRQAILVECMVRAPRGAMPDVDEVARRMELEGLSMSAEGIAAEAAALAARRDWQGGWRGGGGGGAGGNGGGMPGGGGCPLQ